jgi:hypothetical protein
METRDITQYKIYFLKLNTFGSAESGRIVACASNEEALKKWYDEQKLEQSEMIGGWVYNFKKESKIREYNPLYQWQPSNQDVFGHGWFSEWVNPLELRTDIYRIDF